MAGSIHEVVHAAFTDNSRHPFRVKHLTGIDSYIIEGDVELIGNIIKVMIGAPLKLFADYGYTVHVYRSQRKVLLRNYDKYTSAKWRSIWRRG